MKLSTVSGKKCKKYPLTLIDSCQLILAKYLFKFLDNFFWSFLILIKIPKKQMLFNKQRYYWSTHLYNTFLKILETLPYKNHNLNFFRNLVPYTLLSCDAIQLSGETQKIVKASVLQFLSCFKDYIDILRAILWRKFKT